MFFCPICQIENRLDAKFCRKCGQSRDAIEQQALVSASATSAQIQLKFTQSSSTDSTDATAQALIEAPDFSTPQCPSCFTALRFTDKFCCWCGEAQPLRNPNLRTCLQCTSVLPGRANYCYFCGAEVNLGNPKFKAQFELFLDEESEDFPRFQA